MRADEIVRRGCGERYTGAVLRIECGGALVFERAYGTLDDSPGARDVEPTTRFDLASLTKVYVATAALRAVADGTLALDAPVAASLGEWRRTLHARVTLRMLLAHTAGLQSGADFRTLFDERVETYALARPLVTTPGERVVYSDLGFIALGVLLSRAHRRSLAAVVAGTLAALKCSETGFRARNDAAAAIPATEEEPWRGRVRGAVHDEKAFLMHGVAGHAGLFGTARDVARLAAVFLAAARGRRCRGLPEDLARAAIAEHGADPVLRRGLGWALKTSDRNSCGAAMHRSTFGHTGFTGTSVWADPVRDLCVVLLTNAVYFGRRDLRDLRAAVCDAAAQEYATCARSA